MPSNGDGPAQRQADEQEMGQPGKLTLGLLLLALGFVLLYLLVTLWPAVEAANGGEDGGVTWFWRRFALSADATILLLVILVSALGSYIHVTVSFSDFAGNRQLVASWMWWYVLRVFVGSALAVLFYFAIRGGFFSAASDSFRKSTCTASRPSRASSGSSPSRPPTSCARSSTPRSGPNRAMATTRAATGSPIPRRPDDAPQGERTRIFTWRSLWSTSSSKPPVTTSASSMRSVMMPSVEIEPSWSIAIVSAKSSGV